MPDLKTNLLLGAGVLALSQTLTLWDHSLIPTASAADAATATPAPAGDEGGGGEGGGEGGAAVPQSYALNSTDPKRWTYDAKEVIDAYVQGVHAQYVLAAAEGGKLQAAVDALLADPSQATLDAARAAWTAARPAYLISESYRFYDGPIEAVEGRMNSWPMNEAYIDYTKDDPKSGIINDDKVPATAEALSALNQKEDEADVTTGWHAVEFLLWGQDLDPNGPGNRPFTDYKAGTPSNDKRRLYLKSVTDLLANDLKGLASAWDLVDPKSYAAKFAAMKPREAIGRMMNGIAVLSGSELRSERMAVALDSGDQEDEQSCFSDTTHQDFVYDIKGVANVYYGRYPGGERPSLASLVTKLDPERAKKIDALMADATAKIDVLGQPWDQVLASPPDSPQRQAGEAAVAALGALSAELKASGSALGVLVQIPGM